MAGVYGVEPTDIEAEVPGLFPSGFTQSTKPTLATVTSWITDADAYVDAVVSDASSRVQQAATDSDVEDVPDIIARLSPLARRYVIADVLARLYRAVYAGKASPADIAAMLGDLSGTALLTQMETLVQQAIDIIVKPPVGPVIGISATIPTRSLLITDDDLDAGPVAGIADPGAETSSARRGRF